MWSELEELKARTDVLEALCKEQAAALKEQAVYEEKLKARTDVLEVLCKEQAVEISVINARLTTTEMTRKKIRRKLSIVLKDWFAETTPSESVVKFEDKQCISFAVVGGVQYGTGTIQFYFYTDKITSKCFGGPWQYNGCRAPTETPLQTLTTPIAQQRINQAAEFSTICGNVDVHVLDRFKTFLVKFLTSPQVPTVNEIMDQLEL